VRGFRPSPHSLQIPFIFQTKQCTSISEPWLAPAGSRVIIADVQSRQKTKSFFLDKRCLFYYITNSSYFFLHVPFVERSLPLLSQRKSAGKRLHSAFPSLRVFIAPAFFRPNPDNNHSISKVQQQTFPKAGKMKPVLP